MLLLLSKQPTEKHVVQRVTHEVSPELEQMELISRQTKAYGSFLLLDCKLS